MDQDDLHDSLARSRLGDGLGYDLQVGALIGPGRAFAPAQHSVSSTLKPGNLHESSRVSAAGAAGGSSFTHVHLGQG